MPTLHWTLPVIRWSCWPDGSGTSAVPLAGFVTPMTWRRLSSLSKIALKVAHDCVAPQQKVRMIFASRHGELKRTTRLLLGMGAVEPEPVSPTAFSLSVLNAVSGISSIARHDRSATHALSAGEETLGYGLLEAFAQYEEDRTSPVLFVYADERADAMYGVVEDETTSGAVALLVGGSAQGDGDESGETMGRLVCSVQECAEDAYKDDAGNEDESRAKKKEHMNQPNQPCHIFSSQRAAVLACLTTHAPSAWQARSGTGASTGTIWQWRWHDGAA